MINGILRRFTAPHPQPPAFPARDRVAMFERRAQRVNNRDAVVAAKMVRVLVILSEGRKA